MPRQARTVLALDGGGIRGIIPALVLAHIETLTGRPVAELFDLMVGTSTGGIVALGLSVPDTQSASGSRFRAEDLVNLYRERGAAIFRSNWWRRLRSLRGLLDETYDEGPLEQALQAYLGSTTLQECRTPVMVTSYDIEARQAVFLKSFNEDHAVLPMADAARATSAAPTYFEPATTRFGGKNHALIDGGVYINSPAVSAYAEALKLFPGDPITVVSLGTGELTRPIPAAKASGWGSAGWVLPLLDCMFDGVAQATDHQMKLFLGDDYFRFQLTLDRASDDMDDASRDNLANLETSARGLIEAEAGRLSELAEVLVDAAKVRDDRRQAQARAVL